MDLGGVALSFANSGCPDAACSSDWSDLTTTLEALRAAGVIDAETERRLLQGYSNTPEGQTAVTEILRFRTIVSDALEAILNGRAVPAELLEAINTELNHCGCVRRLVPDADGYRVTTLFEINKPQDVLMPIAHSLAQILTDVPRERLKQCREARCSCYFIDTSKNKTRAWCSMQRCGNRQKVANYYRRERARTSS